MSKKRDLLELVTSFHAYWTKKVNLNFQLPNETTEQKDRRDLQHMFSEDFLHHLLCEVEKDA